MAKFKLRRYRFISEDTSRLQKVASLRISRVRLIATLAMGVALCAGAGAMLVALTPVKRSVPGFMTGSDRDATLAALTRIDSVARTLKANQAYIDNLAVILDEDRVPTDSASAGTLINPMPIDSLSTATRREQAFVAKIDEREKYNLNVLAPLAAENMIFADPAQGAIPAAESRRSRLLKIIVPVGQGIDAVMDGRVIERAYDAADASYSVLVQGKHGFLVRYSHLDTPLADTGDPVLAGQRLAVRKTARKTHTKYVGIEMWREGTPLVPGEYLYKPHHEAAAPIEAPRGK